MLETFFIGRQLCTADNDCRFIKISEALLSLLRTSEESLYTDFGGKLSDIMHPQNRAVVEAAITYAVATKEPTEFDCRLAVNTDNETWVHCGFSFIIKEGKEYIQCDMADVSHYHAIEAYYKSMLNSLENPVIITDTEKRVWFMNTAAEKNRGMTLENCIGKSCETFRTPFCGTNDCCVLRWKRGDSAAIQTTPDGRSNRVNYTSLRDAREKEIGYVSVSTDITELIETEKRFQLSEERYRLALAQTHDAIWDYDVATDTLYQSQDQAYTDKDYLKIGPTLNNASRQLLASKSIHEDSRPAMQGLVEAVLAGKKKSEASIRIKKDDGEYRWVQITSTTICGVDGIPLRAIAISKDITKEKQREQEFEQERQYRYSITHDAITSYEVNLTKDELTYADPFWLSQLEAKGEISYSEMIRLTKEKVVVEAEARLQMEKTIGRDALLEAYELGKRDIQYEYLRKSSRDATDAMWVCTSVNLIKAPMTGDVCAFIYIKDIDQQKRQELELRKNAERDVLTGLYNRKTVTNLIDKALANQPSDTMQALLMIDIDNFKEINDAYGHLYGDAVLSDIAYKLKKSISPQDIVGRLGGDEFIALLRDYQTKDELLEKTRQIATTLEMIYSSGNRECNISGSIGIVFTPEHGEDFNTLYEKADIALYNAKIRGRNRYSIYTAAMGKSLQSMERPVTAIKETRIGKNFIEHISEYVFRILYLSEDLKVGISSILELISRHFEAQRCYIFRYDAEKNVYSMIFEWLDKGTPHLAKNWENNRITSVPADYIEHFSENGMLIVENTALAPTNIKVLSERIGTKAFLQSMMDEDTFHGFIGVDYEKEVRHFSADELETIKTTAEVIGTFLQNKQNEEETKRYTSTLQTLLDNVTMSSYVVNPRTHELVFLNKRTLSMVPNGKVGDICYKLFMHYDKPCSFCPILKLTDDFDSSYTLPHFNEVIGRWLEISVNNVKWPDGETYCMVNFTDISNYVAEDGKVKYLDVDEA